MILKSGGTGTRRPAGRKEITRLKYGPPLHEGPVLACLRDILGTVFHPRGVLLLSGGNLLHGQSVSEREANLAQLLLRPFTRRLLAIASSLYSLAMTMKLGPI